MQKYLGIPLLTLVLVFANGVTDALSQTPYSYTNASSQRETDLAALKKWIAHQFGCDTDPGDEGVVSIDKLEYYDFTHDGKTQLIVVASTCDSGTSGPDVHAVFSRDGNGGFIEHRIPNIDKRYYEGLAGNHRNYDLSIDLSVEGGLLVETYWDDSSWNSFHKKGVSPLIIRYMWHGHAFVVHSIITPYLSDRQ
jgi:hypothetical protein